MMLWRILIGLILIHSLMAWKPVWAEENSPTQDLHQEIQAEMEKEEPQLLPPVEILWRATLVKNPTIQLALQKMASKTGQLQPQKKSLWTQSLIQGLIQLGGISTAVVSGSAAPLIGSNVLSHVTTPDMAPERLVQVTSADLVLLAKEVEEAQKELILNFLSYRQAKEMEATLNANRKALEQSLTHLPKDTDVSSDILHTLLSKENLKITEAHQTTQMYRNVLVLMAGEDALAEAEKYENNSNAKQK